jgi:hypothetical protein
MIYFTICLLIGWGSGGLDMIFGRPFVTAEQLGSAPFLIFAALCTLVIGIGYGYIWPKGTATHGRSLVLTAVLPFGLLWGLSQGTLFVSIWLLLSKWITADWLLILASFLLLATFIGLWHSQYWDIHIAPEHNLVEWNLRKVLLAHTPNLVLTLTFLTRYESAALFVLWQTMALLLSTYFMRFPPFWGRTAESKEMA